MSILVLTIGTGNQQEPEATLYKPVRKSIEQGRWSRVVLLPSGVTAGYAEELRSQVGRGSFTVDVNPLPEGAEDDPDRSYGHFDQVLADLREAWPGEEIVVDFTRGTKAMSAAIVLAAARHDVRELRYITGERDRRGLVREGTERVRTVPADRIDRQRRADLAREMVGSGDFAAAAELLEGLGPDWEAVRDAARFYSAWDRLNYREAGRIFDGADFGAKPPPGWMALWPAEAMRKWTAALSPTGDDDAPPSQEALRRTIADLIANGERRIAQEQFEEALVRAYRVLELIGQTRLFEHGLDSAKLDPQHPAVKRLKEKLAKKKSSPLQKQRGKLTAGREQVARLLKTLGDDLGSDLLAMPRRNKVLNPSKRNHSLLIHGFRARGGSDPVPIRDALAKLEETARRVWGEDLKADLRSARSIPSR